MDGRENDANQTNGNSSTPGSRGIYSTPDLTVNNTPDLTAPSNDKSRVASIFANTDAGQRSSRLNDAMGLNNATPAYATEDIKIDNGPRKRSKVPIVLLVIVAVIAVVGLIIFMIISNIPSKAPSQNLQTAFSDYYDYLTVGPDDIQEGLPNPDSDFYALFKIRNSDLQTAQVQAYLSELQNKYDVVLKAASSDEEISNYTKYFNLAVAYNSLWYVADVLVEKYENNPEDATKYVTEMTNIEYGDETLDRINATIKKYLEDEIKVIQISLLNNCVKFHKIDAACASNLTESNTTFAELQQTQSKDVALLPLYSGYLQNVFREKTNNLKEKIGDNHAEN